MRMIRRIWLHIFRGNRHTVQMNSPPMSKQHLLLSQEAVSAASTKVSIKSPYFPDELATHACPSMQGGGEEVLDELDELEELDGGGCRHCPRRARWRRMPTLSSTSSMAEDADNVLDELHGGGCRHGRHPPTLRQASPSPPPSPGSSAGEMSTLGHEHQSTRCSPPLCVATVTEGGGTELGVGSNRARSWE